MSAEERLKQAQEMTRQFIMNDAPLQVNITGEAQQIIVNAVLGEVRFSSEIHLFQSILNFIIFNCVVLTSLDLFFPCTGQGHT